MSFAMAEVQRTNRIRTIRELMGLDGEDMELAPQAKKGEAPYAVLPMVEIPQAPETIEETEAPVMIQEKLQPEIPENIDIREFGSPLSRLLARDWVRYPLIFVIALGFFYVVLNFRAISAQIGALISSPSRKEKIAFAEVSPEYNKWIKKYYVYANNPEILEPKNDPDADGLANLEEFYLGTNPLVADTDGDGYNDGREVLDGYNPSYEGRVLAWQGKVIAEHVNTEGMRSRNALQNLTRVAGEQALLFQLDPAKPGNINIPKLGIDAPIIWSREFTRMEEDLKYGAAHHPNTPYPGNRGTASIHGHSSGNPWDGNFKTLFTRINFLEPGDEVFVTVYNDKGESKRYRYVVRSKKVYAKNDPQQFADLGGYFLNLSTSWPVGTAHERYVVTTELVGL